MQHRVVARFQKCNDADAHLRVLRQYARHMEYKVIFDAGST
jgi:hypothetical protein